MAKENIVVFVLAQRGGRNENRLERSEERIESLLTQEIQSVELLTMTSRTRRIETKTKNNKMSMEILDAALLIRFLKFTVYVDRHHIRQVSCFPPCKTIVPTAIWQLPSSRMTIGLLPVVSFRNSPCRTNRQIDEEFPRGLSTRTRLARPGDRCLLRDKHTRR